MPPQHLAQFEGINIKNPNKVVAVTNGDLAQMRVDGHAARALVGGFEVFSDGKMGNVHHN